jgi:hypothetical protein
MTWGCGLLSGNTADQYKRRSDATQIAAGSGSTVPGLRREECRCAPRGEATLDTLVGRSDTRPHSIREAGETAGLRRSRRHPSAWNVVCSRPPPMRDRLLDSFGPEAVSGTEVTPPRTGRCLAPARGLPAPGKGFGSAGRHGACLCHRPAPQPEDEARSSSHGRSRMPHPGLSRPRHPIR